MPSRTKASDRTNPRTVAVSQPARLPVEPQAGRRPAVRLPQRVTLTPVVVHTGRVGRPRKGTYLDN